jgi:hypothetical protein
MYIDRYIFTTYKYMSLLSISYQFFHIIYPLGNFSDHMYQNDKFMLLFGPFIKS